MIKKVCGILLGVSLLAGCSEGTVIYKGKEQPIGQVEEKIADELEVENSDLDLEVDIYSETDE